MIRGTVDPGTIGEVREACHGLLPLTARLEPWHEDLCRRPQLLGEWLEEYGSPINLIEPSALERNAGELESAAARCGVELKTYFARKANKALAFVDEAVSLGLGVDVAGQRELEQALKRGVPSSDLVVTAAVKPTALLELCVVSGATVVIDNQDELEQLAAASERLSRGTNIALRLAPAPAEGRPETRFGMSPARSVSMADRFCGTGPGALRVDGVHFHLDGYDAADRVAALAESLRVIDALRTHGHRPSFVDIGGGVPMSYLDDALQWAAFWEAHRAALLGERKGLTFEGHGLGLTAHGGEILGRPNAYPSHQAPVRGDWLAEILRAQIDPARGGASVADELRSRSLELRCEPGRSLLDGCGMTAARVEFRKQRRDGTWLIGLAMNRTQCRSTSDDFLVDPLLLRPTTSAAGSLGSRTGPISGFLVGAYCIERELLSWRRLNFPRGVEVGDIVVFPNTAGYLMHILESASHQIPLARNLVVGGDRSATLDRIDAPDRLR